MIDAIAGTIAANLNEFINDNNNENDNNNNIIILIKNN